MLTVADMHGQLLSATQDLTRLEALLDDACQILMRRFHHATDEVRGLPTPDGDARDSAVRQIAGAVTALQFQDLASQLIAHTCQRLNYCTGQLARVAVGDAAGAGEAGKAGTPKPPLRPNPVTQTEMEPGSVEVFQTRPSST